MLTCSPISVRICFLKALRVNSEGVYATTACLESRSSHYLWNKRIVSSRSDYKTGINVLALNCREQIRNLEKEIQFSRRVPPTGLQINFGHFTSLVNSGLQGYFNETRTCGACSTCKNLCFDEWICKYALLSMPLTSPLRELPIDFQI